MERVRGIFLLPARAFRSFLRVSILKRPFGLKAKLTLLIVAMITTVLAGSGYLDYQISKKAQIGLYLDRTLYIAKQIDLGLPDLRLRDNLSRVEEEIEEWLLSRPFLTEIDVFLFSSRHLQPVASISRDGHQTPLHLGKDQMEELKKDGYLSSLLGSEGEKRLEVIVPLHSGKKVNGGIRVISSLEEAESYLSRKKGRMLIFMASSLLIILLIVSVSFKRIVGDPLQKLVEAMSQAEKGHLDVQVKIESDDELGLLGRHFNRMLKTIRDTHEQNVILLTQVSRFNDELTKRIDEATSELAKKNEELRLLNEALFKSQRELGQLEKLAALGKVTATLAHQIGTPLNSISGYIQLILQEGNLQPKDRKRLEIIESQLDRLTDSIKNILSSTSLPKPQFKPINVNEIFEELIQFSGPWFHTRNVKVITSLSPNVPIILGDFARLQTLFLNLITNAVEAMPEGGILEIRTQTARSTTSSAHGEYLEISITDTGIGITEESKKRIFDPFYTTKKAGEGTGLGLAICQDIVKEHGGRVEVMSKVGKGSTFSIFIPAIKEEMAYELQSGPPLGG